MNKLTWEAGLSTKSPFWGQFIVHWASILDHYCWVSLYSLTFFFPCLHHCFLPDSCSDSATKLRAPGFVPVWHVGMIVLSCSTLTSVAGFCSPFILSCILLPCIHFKQPALYNMVLQFSTINHEKYGSIWPILMLSFLLSKSISEMFGFWELAMGKNYFHSHLIEHCDLS